ncbi:alginate lyase family protein [Enterococcus sp. DIV0197]|uniref:alginate lyase family protein n=1 Tax=unclassified Enterococcus TaxID=2608891 RepID=UPI003D279CA7
MEQNFKGFFNCTSQEELFEFKEELLKNNEKECQELLARSQRFVSGEYLFDNAWDMERTHEPVFWQVADIEWSTSPNGDLEWLYMLHRHRFLVDVGLAYLLTEEPEYQEYLERFLHAFLQHNPLNQLTKQSSWRTIDVGLRVVNWLKLVEMNRFLPLFSDELKQKVETALEIQGTYLYENLSIERGQSNWQVLEIAGLYSLSLAFPNFEKADLWQAESLFYLTHSFALQVEADGMQREQSFMYHNEVLLCLLEILQLAQRTATDVPEKMVDYAKQLARAASLFVKPNGQQPMYGDSDQEDMTGLLQYAEVILTNPEEPVKKNQADLTFFAKTSLGRGQFPITDCLLLKEAFHHFEQAGIMIAKSPLTYHLFKCGPLGGGHGHDDLLHIDLAYQGKDILIDSGRYSYELSKHRLVFKEATAHNTIVVDKENFNQHTDAWDSVKVATPINQKATEKSGIQFFEGGHLGYFTLADPVYVDRKVIHFPEGFSFVSDSYICRGNHEIETFFHFDSSTVQQKQSMLIFPELGYEISCLAKEARWECYEKNSAPTYNELRKITCARAKKNIQGTAATTYLLNPQGLVTKVEKLPVYSEAEQQPDEVVEAIKVQLKDRTQKLILIQHQEPAHGRRAYCVEGEYYYGRVVVTTDQEKIVLY